MTMAQLNCRACGERGLSPILSLGHMPLANALLTDDQLDEPETTFPLDLVFCPSCSLVQITETVDPARLFGHYLYFSSVSETMLAHARKLARHLVAERDLGPSSLVVEIGSNDGYLLQYYKEAGIPVLGVEPAANVADVAEQERGIPTLCGFFGAEMALRLVAEGRQADLVHAHNVLAHVADLPGFVRGLARLVKPEGRVVIEVPYLKDLLERRAFDTIYHEHLCYFSLTALHRLLGSLGLRIAQVEQQEIHGSSLRLVIARSGPEPNPPSTEVQALLEEEQAWGVDQAESYLGFALRVQELRRSLRSLIEGLVAQGMRVAAYGAAAKGTILLNYVGLGRDLIDFVVDRSVHKQGRYIPGVRLPIYAPEKLLRVMPDYVLLLPWNISDEILEQQSEFLRRGGRFVVPIPQPRIVPPLEAFNG